nr:hypothetical protein L204_03614 [Cryptococcus depauperatus CBS 7855]
MVIYVIRSEVPPKATDATENTDATETTDANDVTEAVEATEATDATETTKVTDAAYATALLSLAGLNTTDNNPRFMDISNPEQRKVCAGSIFDKITDSYVKDILRYPFNNESLNPDRNIRSTALWEDHRKTFGSDQRIQNTIEECFDSLRDGGLLEHSNIWNPSVKCREDGTIDISAISGIRRKVTEGFVPPPSVATGKRTDNGDGDGDEDELIIAGTSRLRQALSNMRPKMRLTMRPTMRSKRKPMDDEDRQRLL